MSIEEYAHFLSLVCKLEIYDNLKLCEIGPDNQPDESNDNEQQTPSSSLLLLHQQQQ